MSQNYYSIEFSTIKIGWIPLLLRQNEHIKILGVIKDYREIKSITGSKEYALQEQLNSIVFPYKKLLNKYASCLHCITKRIRTLQKDAIKEILLNADTSLKNLTLYKNLLDFVNTKEVLALNNFLPV